jgi:hypothetical protein
MPNIQHCCKGSSLYTLLIRYNNYFFTMHSFSRRMPKSLHSLNILRQNLSNGACPCWRSPPKLQEDILEIRRFSTIVWGRIGCRQSDIKTVCGPSQKERYKFSHDSKSWILIEFCVRRIFENSEYWNMSCCPCFDSQHKDRILWRSRLGSSVCGVYGWLIFDNWLCEDQRDELEKAKKKRKCFPNSCDSESLDAHLILCWLIKPSEV